MRQRNINKGLTENHSIQIQNPKWGIFFVIQFSHSFHKIHFLKNAVYFHSFPPSYRTRHCKVQCRIIGLGSRDHGADTRHWPPWPQSPCQCSHIPWSWRRRVCSGSPASSWGAWWRSCWSTARTSASETPSHATAAWSRTSVWMFPASKHQSFPNLGKHWWMK